MSGGVTVRWGFLDRDRAASLEPVLSPDERARAQRFRFRRDRARFVSARGLCAGSSVSNSGWIRGGWS